MANLNTSESLDTWCRTCMNNTATLFDVFLDTVRNTSIANILMSCTRLNIEAEDGLPRRICLSCYNCIRNFTEFRDAVEKADLKLKDILRNLAKDVKVEYEPTNNYDNLIAPITELKHELEIQTDVNYSLDDETYEDTSELFVSDLNIGNESNFERNENKINTDCTNSVVNPSNVELYKCKKCYKKFKRLVNYKKHLSKHNSVVIGIVKEELDENTNNHKNQSENEEDHECKLCGKIFKTLHSLSAHMRKHVSKGRILACGTCGKVFKKTSHLKRHEVIHYNKVPRKCSMCPKSFRTENQLQAHLNLHNDIKPHICSFCNKAFTNHNTLTNHMKIHSRDKLYLCPTCGKRFDSSTNLNQHIKRHIGMKTFACNLCPKTFVSKGELKSHIITHTGERSYKCESCGAGFTKHSSLVQHRLRHLGLKPHHCDACPMKFTSKDHLKRHYRIHTGEKPYRCDMCERAFTQSNDLVKHQRGHLGDNMYKCSQCNESFRLKTELRQHTSQHYLSAQSENTNAGNEPAKDIILNVLPTNNDDKADNLVEEK